MSGILAGISRAFASAGLPAALDSGHGSILFFSGGSALKDVARELSTLTPNTTHVVSTFDSGGSTAEIRRVFNTPAIGDLRLRLSSLSGCAFFERRLGPDSAGGAAELHALTGGAGGLPEHFRERLDFFRQVMPTDFNLAGAALGNLILAADYLRNGRSLYASISRISSELGVSGRVLPVSEDSVQLAVRLESGEILVGQHNFTGKHGKEPNSPIREMFFCREPDDLSSAPVSPGPGVLEAVGASSLICYPVGSFYSSVLANLQVNGIGEAVRRSRAKKVFMPNPDRDPESAHLSLEEQLETLCRAVSGVSAPDAAGIVDFLLVDSRTGKYRSGIPQAWCERQGVKIIDFNQVENDSTGRAVLSPERSAKVLQQLSGLRTIAS